MNINWRLASRLSVISLALLVVALVALIQHNAGASKTLQGTSLDGAPASDFHLSDQFGKPVALSDFKGKPVVLTFLYTHCPDVCPLTAEKLHATMQLLAQDGPNVSILAVSTDPKNDTQQAALDFSNAHKLQDSWHFLIGPREQLAPIWTSYSVTAKAVTGSNEVDHSIGLFVIDKQGKERVFLGDDFAPSQLADDLRTLLKE
jgi:protein SCO1/2